MKIYYLSQSLIPSRFANSVQVMRMCHAFAKNGHEVILFASQGEESGKDPFAFYGVEPCFALEYVDVTIQSRDRLSYLLWRAAQAWRRSLPIGDIFKRRRKYKYAWHIVQRSKQLGLPDLFYSRLSPSLEAIAHIGVPMIFESHILPHRPALLHAEYRLYHYKNLQRLVVISEALKRSYVELFPWLDETKILVARSGADLPPLDDVQQLISWPGRRGCLQVGYVGSLYPGRGIEIISALASRLTAIDFHIVGGREEDLSHWKVRAAFPNLYYHGHIPPASVPAYYRHFDLVLAPYQERIMISDGTTDTSRWASPLKIFEYMAHQKAIIASDLPILREILQQHKTAMLVAANDRQAWEEAILMLQENPEQRRVLGQSAQDLLTARYTWKSRAEQVLAAV